LIDHTQPLNSPDEAGERDAMQVRFFHPTAARIRVSLILLVSMVSSAATAAERIPLDVAVDWGLLGKWALDCDGRPSNANPFYSYVMVGDKLLIRRDTGVLQDENKVISGTIADDGGIELVTEYKAFSVVMTTRYIKDNADQFHPVFVRNDKGVYGIQDGKSTKTGLAAPVMTRCVKTNKS
jgi:hypothetical protein